jgi:hypothetical protein
MERSSTCFSGVAQDLSVSVCRFNETVVDGHTLVVSLYRQGFFSEITKEEVFL